MTDREIIQALVEKDGQVTEQFFYKDCRPLFSAIIRKVFDGRADYDEIAGELYCYLMEDDARRLRQFKGRSSIFQWLKVTATRFCIAKRDGLIENQSGDALLNQVDIERQAETGNAGECSMDVDRLLEMLPNKRYAYVIRRLVLEDAEPKEVAEEIRTNVDNLYNVRRRAMASLTKLAIQDIIEYGK